MEKLIRTSADLPPDKIQTDPLRRLVNVWRQRGENVCSDHLMPYVSALYECADELTALLNERDRNSARLMQEKPSAAYLETLTDNTQEYIRNLERLLT